jgi:histidyl-tRNA synthetase
MKISKQKGTRDIFLDEVNIWQYIEKNIREICRENNVNEIRTPVFEATELFKRSVGDETDIVNKEMYTFLDKGNRSVTLRPELTAGVVRAYIENGMASLATPLKLWYIGNMYRYEKMQKGRYREFSQFGVEIFGSASYLADVESICMSYELFKRLNLEKKIVLSINSIGCKVCRQKYIDKLKKYLEPKLENMCDTCKKRYDKNPMRILDCKEKKCQDELIEAPIITDNLCEECNTDFLNLQSVLNEINIPYVIDKSIVRGLDYYNRTVYEYVSKDLGISVGGGGRYDGLVSMLEGKDTPAVGFALGMDRVVLLLKELEIINDLKKEVDLYFLVLEEKGYIKAKNIAMLLNERGYITDLDISNRSMKAQLKYANKINAKYVCIMGEDELIKEKCIIKNMETGKQEDVKLEFLDIMCKLV